MPSQSRILLFTVWLLWFWWHVGPQMCVAGQTKIINYQVIKYVDFFSLSCFVHICTCTYSRLASLNPTCRPYSLQNRQYFFDFKNIQIIFHFRASIFHFRSANFDQNDHSSDEECQTRMVKVIWPKLSEWRIRENKRCSSKIFATKRRILFQIKETVCLMSTQ